MPLDLRRKESSFVSSAPLAFVLPLAFIWRGAESRLGKLFWAATLASACIGTVCSLLVLAGSKGANVEISNKIAGLDSHLLVRLPESDKLLCGDNALLQHLEKMQTIRAAAPYVLTDVVLGFPDGASQPLMLKGIDLQREHHATDINRYLHSGRLPDVLTGSHDVELPLILGASAAETLGIGEGETITVTKQSGLSSGKFPARVFAIFKTGTLHDSQIAYTTLQWARRVHGVAEDCVSGVAVRTADPLTSSGMAAVINKQFPKYEVSDWSSSSPNFKSAISLLQRWLMFLTWTIFGLAALFATSVVLLVMHERRRELAVLLTLGINPIQLRAYVSIVGTILGAFGVLFGTIASFALSVLLTRYQIVRLPEEHAVISYLPFHLETGHVLLVTSIQIVLPAVAGWWATGDLKKLRPAEVLRDE